MNRILEVDLPNRRMRVQPGVINLDISKHLAPHGYYYAPDPSSQSVCTIGRQRRGELGRRAFA